MAASRLLIAFPAPQAQYSRWSTALYHRHYLHSSPAHHGPANDITIAATGREVTVPTGLFINNRFVPSVDSKETIQCINPATEEVICSVVAGSDKDIDVAVAAARKAFKTTWGKNVTGFERSRLLTDAQELAELESLNNGSPSRSPGCTSERDFDIGDSVQCLRYYAGWADKILGQSIEVDNKTKVAFTVTIPSAYVARSHPLTALKLSELIVEAGFPPGVVNTVPSLGSVGGAALAAHMDVDKVAFTGSTVTGRKIMDAAAKSNLKKLSLELGGKSPHIVFESADLDQAANWAGLGILYNTGQDCTAGSRLFVQDTVYDKFVQLLVEKFKQLKISSGFDEDAGAGPVVSKTQYDKIFSYIEAGKQGARVILGARSVQAKATLSTLRVRDEIFGPVLAVAKFSTEEEAIELANDTMYGLGAGLHSNDASQCMRVSQALEAGTVWVNQYNLLNNNVPFGGKKQSGIGRELGSYALEEYTSVKAIHWNYGEKLDWPL
ncbi:NAD-aldehyde dehydrogenase [Trametes punicea]|nr:NAD-aldehyde dehydrogenase [Trametes punicea]